MAETGTNYTTALRAYDAATGHLYAKADVTESELPPATWSLPGCGGTALPPRGELTALV